MSRKSGLGRGLGALIPNDISISDDDSALQEVAIDSVVPNRLQPREHFEEDALVALTASIRELGVLQPILVRPTDGGFELIAGERRWRSAKRAGLTTIPAIIRTIDDQVSLEHAIVENLHRQDLNAIEEAAAYRQLIDDFGLTQDEVSSRVGKSRSAVANTLRLLNLTTSVQRLLTDGLLSAGHARSLVVVSDPGLQEELATRVIAEGLTVRQIEAIVRGDAIDTDVDLTPAGTAGTGSDGTPDSRSSSTANPKPSSSGKGSDDGLTTRSAALLDLEQMLADRLDTRVAVEMGAKHGKVVIEFADIDDLERIARIVVTGESHSE